MSPEIKLDNKIKPFTPIEEEENVGKKAQMTPIELNNMPEFTDSPGKSNKKSSRPKSKKFSKKNPKKSKSKKIKKIVKPDNRVETKPSETEKVNPQQMKADMEKVKLYEYKRYTEIWKEVRLKLKVNPKKTTFLISWRWLNSWVKYVTSNGSHPGPIDNRALWHNIFNEKKVERGADYYIIDQKIWEYLHNIYTGGPILHKEKNDVNSETVSVRSSLTSFDGTSVGGAGIETETQSNFGAGVSRENSIPKFDHESISRGNMPKRTSFKSNGKIDSNGSDINKIEGLFAHKKHSGKLHAQDPTTRYFEAPIAEMPDDENDYDKKNSESTQTALQYSKDYIDEDDDDSDYDDEGEEEEEEDEGEGESETEQTISDWRFNIIGLKNPGNFWYMNVCLQALLSVDELVQFYLKIDPNDLLKLAKVSKKKDNISYLFARFCHEALVEDREDAYNPIMLQNAVKKVFSTQMQDTHEFLLYFFSKLQDEENRFLRALAASKGIKLSKEPDPSKEVSAQVYWAKYKDSHSSVIDKLFTGLLSTSVTRKWWSKTTRNFEPFIDLSLEIKRESVNGCLKDYFTEEAMNIDADFICEDCKITTKAIIKKKIEKAPSNLIIHLKRFEYPSLRKVRSVISYKHSIDISKYVQKHKQHDPNSNQYRYSLYGMIIHKGKEMDRGHYTSVFKRENNWYEFDDDKVYEIQGKENTRHVLGREIYILLYKRDNWKLNLISGNA